MTDDETDTLIAGYLVCWTMFDECQILNIVVDLEYRGLGLGKFMINKIFALATKRNIRKVVLEVRKSNLSAIYLYQKMGFSITHVRKGFYSNGEDAYSMVAFLDEGGFSEW
jgi:ribosomal-protein-alanine N-acetyltransferase